MENNITFVAMDTHKKEHRVALVYPNDEEVIEFSVKNAPTEIRKMVRNIKGNAPGKVKEIEKLGNSIASLKGVKLSKINLMIRGNELLS